MSFRDVEQMLQDTLAPVLAARDIDLEGVTVQLAGKRRLVRLLVDKDDGVSLDEVAAISKLTSAELDSTNALGEASYVLEVSSPGTERPLTQYRHWRRNLDRLVRVYFTDEREPIDGRIRQASPEAVVVDVSGESQEIPMNGIAKAVVQLDFKGDKKSSSSGKRESA